jgi:predicted nucleic acid-binding protein
LTLSPKAFVLDSGPPSTFARVSRLDLLEMRCLGRAHMPLEVRAEIIRGVRPYPQLQSIIDARWIAIEPPISNIESLRKLELTRMALAGSVQHPKKNLGEAAVIELALVLHAEVVIDDFDAITLARQRGLRVLTTGNLLAESVAMGELTCQEAIALYESMRQVTSLPALTKRDIC